MVDRSQAATLSDRVGIEDVLRTARNLWTEAMHMKRIGGLTGLIGAFLVAVTGATPALAQGEPTDLPIIGIPSQDGMGFQPAATELARDIHWLDTMLHVMMGVIVLFVLALLVVVVVALQPQGQPDSGELSPTTPGSRSPGR